MGLMTYLRERGSVILLGAIGFAVFAFLVGDAISVGQPFWAANQKTVGTVDGVDISYDDFGPKVDQQVNQYKQQFGGSVNAQMQAMAVEQAWNGELANILLNKEFDKVGLSVSGDELWDLIQGKNPSPIITQYFSDPQTGVLNRNALTEFLKSRNAQAALLENEIEQQALQQKYSNLIRNSIYVTTLEANDDYINRNKLANFSYVSLDYASIADNTVKPTDADYKAYYDANKARFNNPVETRSFSYVSFSINPTAQDSIAIKTQVEKLAADFKTTTNDSLFAAVNSDVKVPYTYLSKGNMDPQAEEVIFNLPVGSYYGPELIGSSYKLAKVVGSRFSPDSVKASHILIDAAKLGGEDKALKLADSLKSVVQKGGDFAALAKEFSVDGSKDQGGDLGTFARGVMVPEFENAAFEGNTGDVKVVKSQFGVHVIKINKQVGSTKVVKVAYIEKGLASSSKTQTAAYKAASNFLNEAKGKDFAKYAEEKGLTVGIADRVAANQGYAPGLDNPRKLIQAAYEADKGDVLPEIYTMTDSYVVAKLNDINPKGALPLEAVKKDIETAVINEVKAKTLAAKLESAGSSLEQISAKVGQAVTPVENVVFANPMIPGLSQENKLVGSVFGAQPGKVSKAVAGDRGVYVYTVTGFTNPAPIDNMFKQKEMMLLGVSQRSLGAAFQALQESAKIKDNRVKFY